MLYTGIDYHRKYSVLRTLDVAGTHVKHARIEHDQPEAFASYFASLPEVSRVVMDEVTLVLVRNSEIRHVLTLECDLEAQQPVR